MRWKISYKLAWRKIICWEIGVCLKKFCTLGPLLFVNRLKKRLNFDGENHYRPFLSQTLILRVIKFCVPSSPNCFGWFSSRARVAPISRNQSLRKNFSIWNSPLHPKPFTLELLITSSAFVWNPEWKRTGLLQSWSLYRIRLRQNVVIRTTQERNWSLQVGMTFRCWKKWQNMCN